MVGYIYKYENEVNHKVYIGQTIDLDARHSSHVNKSKTVKSKFYNAVRKYGWSNFKRTILFQISAENIDELSSLLDASEEYYIEQYDSYNNGYNSTTGGHSCREKQMPDSFIEYCRNREYSEETRKKMSEAAHNKKVSKETRQKLSLKAKERRFAEYRLVTTEKRNMGIKKALSKPILQLDENGNVLNKFSAINEAVEYIIKNYAPNRKRMGIWKGLYRHFTGKIIKRLYYGFEWKLETNV